MTVKIDGTNTVANPAFTGADTDTGLQCGTNEIKLVTGGTARATVDSSGRLSSEGTSQFSHKYTGASNPVLFGQYNSSGNASINNQANAPLLFATNNTERASLDSAGQIQIGTNRTKTDVASTVAAFVQTRFSGPYTNYSAIRESGPASFCFGRANGSGSQILSDGDEIGGIRWAGADGTDLETQAALIQAFVHGTPGSNNMPGRLKFSTSSGASAPTERLGIGSDGVITTNGVQHQSDRGATTGNSSFTRDFGIGATQSALVISAFNHFGLFSYGCSRLSFAATGGSFSTSDIHTQSTGNGGSWSISKPNNTTLRVTKNAGSHTGSGHWFIHVIAS